MFPVRPTFETLFMAGTIKWKSAYQGNR